MWLYASPSRPNATTNPPWRQFIWDPPSTISETSRDLTVDVAVGGDGQIVVMDELKLPKVFIAPKSYNYTRIVEIERKPRLYNIILDRCRPAALYITLVAYLVLGGVALYICESLIYKLPENTPEVVKMPRNGCLQQFDFWHHIIYAVSLVTTVSYGQMYACSPYGQAL